MNFSPIRIGILLTSLGKSEASALKYLILNQNSLQNCFEFQFLPIPEENTFLKSLESNKSIDRLKIEQDMPGFKNNYLKWARQDANQYNLILEKLDGFVILSTAKFSDQFYSATNDNWAIIALGHWKRHMAPPSIVEFFLNLLIQVSIDFACGEEWPHRHHTTKGCTFDFTASLDDVRFKVLTGFVCSKCVDAMKNAHSQALVNDVKLLQGKKWLGKASEPTDVSTTAKKLGYDLFHTRGVKQTFWERVSATLEEAAVKTLLKIIGAVLIAGLLFWLGLRST